MSVETGLRGGGKLNSHLAKLKRDRERKVAAKPKTLGAVAEGPTITYPAGTSFPKDLPPRKGGVPLFLAEKMRLFQSASPIPIHLKGGPTDKVLFASTVVLCAIGLTGCLSFFYDMSFTKKADD
ncbi:uncharacterized protein LOC135225758 [Macrobrachium nipponense]|uniref:uncharacterized protein LOC135225758 n=1 Tax=Macrobrachium nipponense TaxID=159736 RepID=UPI0030C832B7